jgi:hypothetical protein
MVYVALVLHTIVSIWILGNDAIFVSDEFQSGSPLIQDGISFLRRGHLLPLGGIGSVVTQRHTIVLSATLLFLIMYGMIHHLYRLSRGVTRCTVACVQCFLCGRGWGWGLQNVLLCFKKEEEEEEGRGLHVSFRDAKRSKLLKGLHTYNLFKNPEYMRAVRIRESSADSDRRLGSGVELVEECSSESETFTV